MGHWEAVRLPVVSPRRLGVSEFDDARVVLKELFLFLRESRAK